MSGKAFMFIGMRGMGKSHAVKELIKPVNPDSLLVFDPNAEYTGLYSHPPIIEFKKFSALVPKVKKAVIVVEEATVFLSNRGYDIDFQDTIVRARHTDNTVILVFHSFQDVPKYLFRLVNYVILLKTNDTVDYVDTTFRNKLLTDAFTKIKTAPLLQNKEGKKYSPKIMIDLFAPVNDESTKDQ